MKFIHALKQNISLSELNLNDNPIFEDKNFIETIKEELYINKQIKQHITSNWMTELGKRDRKALAKKYKSKLFNEIESKQLKKTQYVTENDPLNKLLMAKVRSTYKYKPNDIKLTPISSAAISSKNLKQILKDDSSSSTSSDDSPIEVDKEMTSSNVSRKNVAAFPNILKSTAFV